MLEHNKTIQNICSWLLDVFVLLINDPDDDVAMLLLKLIWIETGELWTFTQWQQIISRWCFCYLFFPIRAWHWTFQFVNYLEKILCSKLPSGLTLRHGIMGKSLRIYQVYLEIQHPFGKVFPSNAFAYGTREKWWSCGFICVVLSPPVRHPRSKKRTRIFVFGTRGEEWDFTPPGKFIGIFWVSGWLFLVGGP